MYFIEIYCLNCVGGGMYLYMGDFCDYETVIRAAQEYAKSEKILCAYVYNSDNDDIIYENRYGVEIFYA